jgi:hypothetical protein
VRKTRWRRARGIQPIGLYRIAVKCQGRSKGSLDKPGPSNGDRRFEFLSLSSVSPRNSAAAGEKAHDRRQRHGRWSTDLQHWRISGGSRSASVIGLGPCEGVPPRRTFGTNLRGVEHGPAGTLQDEQGRLRSAAGRRGTMRGFLGFIRGENRYVRCCVIWLPPDRGHQWGHPHAPGGSLGTL